MTISGSTLQGSATRTGIAIGIGVIVTILPIVDLDGSIKYHLLNLIGKSSGEQNIDAFSLNIAIIF